MPAAASVVICLRKSRRCSSMLTSRSRSGGAFPAEPIDDRPTHQPLEIAALQPRQFFGEHRHALPVRARHAGDVGAPERALRPERLEDLTQIAVDVPEWVGLARIARST